MRSSTIASVVLVIIAGCGDSGSEETNSKNSKNSTNNTNQNNNTNNTNNKNNTNPCQTGGCSGEVCASAEGRPADTACVDKPEYACYREHSECGPFGADGACAWKETPELTACLEAPCPTECGAWCAGLAAPTCPNPGCRCPEPPPSCPDGCAEWCNGKRPDCPDPGCDCLPPCGAEGQLCCGDKSCDEGLTCCEGVPYHDTWGTCETACTMVSDRAAKTDVEPANADAVLAALAKMPISTWRYLVDGSDVRHLGPMAQDFRSAFGLGSSERRIHVADAAGVTMAAVQALYRRLQQLEVKNQQLQDRVSRLKAGCPR